VCGYRVYKDNWEAVYPKSYQVNRNPKDRYSYSILWKCTFGQAL